MSRPLGLPAEVSKPLDGLATRLQAALARNLVGLYLHGSLTQGAYHPRRSDIDCLALVRRNLTDRAGGALGRRLAGLARANRRTHRLQLMVLARRDPASLARARPAAQNRAGHRADTEAPDLTVVLIALIALFAAAARESVAQLPLSVAVTVDTTCP